jgi:hypothetical protein
VAVVTRGIQRDGMAEGPLGLATSRAGRGPTELYLTVTIKLEKTGPRITRLKPQASSVPATSRLALPPEAVRLVERTRSSAKASR